MRNASRPIHSIFILISVLIYTVIKYNYHSVIEYKSKVTWMGMGGCKLSFPHNAFQFNQDNHAYKDFKSP